MKRVAILGAGEWEPHWRCCAIDAIGPALARDRAGRGDWTHPREQAASSASASPDNVEVTPNACDATGGSDLIVVAIPSAYLRATLRDLAERVPPGIPALSVIKGIENRSFARPSQIVAETLGRRTVSVLSGPGHAEELARGLPASLVVAGADESLNVRIRDALSQDVLRVYTNPDSLGVELAGALKNILGIAAGICDGLGFGDNAKAALLTRGLVEIARLGVHLGAHQETFYGLAGIGDVVTTCYSRFGRNRAVGERLGRGEALDEILAGMVNVAEGVPTTRSVYSLARRRSQMPITQELYQIMDEGNRR